MTKLEQDALCSQVLEVAAELYGATRVELDESRGGSGALQVYRDAELIGRVSKLRLEQTDYTPRNFIRWSLECMAPGCGEMVGTNPRWRAAAAPKERCRAYHVCGKHDEVERMSLHAEAERRGIIPLQEDPYREAREREAAIERVERAELARLKAKYEGAR